MPQTLPKSANVVFEKIREILNRGLIPIPEKFNGNGAPGNTLEQLLNVDENNNDSPDLLDWELKFHGGNSLITLMHKTPLPRGVMNKIVHNHGWKDAEDRFSFRHTIRGSSNRGFKLKNVDDKLAVLFEDEIIAYWEHNTLLNALAGKLRRLIVVEGIYDSKERMVDYQYAHAFWDINVLGFCKAVENGLVYVDFDARTKSKENQKIRDHGTKFRINIKDLSSMYDGSIHISERNVEGKSLLKCD